jgi:hypothetical protein
LVDKLQWMIHRVALVIFRCLVSVVVIRLSWWLAESLFAWLISHQPAVIFSQNKPVTSNQPAVLFSQNKPAPDISHQPTEQGPGRQWLG